MKKNTIAMTVALGAAYLLRNPESREKLKKQFKGLANGRRK